MTTRGLVLWCGVFVSIGADGHGLTWIGMQATAFGNHPSLDSAKIVESDVSDDANNIMKNGVAVR